MKSLAKIAVALIVLITSPALLAQWPRYMAAGASKGADGKVDLDAAVPRTADGKPDLAGVWDVIPCIDCPQARGGSGRGAAPAGQGRGANAAPAERSRRVKCGYLGLVETIDDPNVYYEAVHREAVLAPQPRYTG